MALKRLALRGVMWGADKIPDEWFDKMPGDLYKDDAKTAEQNGKINRGRDSDRDRYRGQRSSSARHASDGKYRSDRHSHRDRDRDRDYDHHPRSSRDSSYRSHRDSHHSGMRGGDDGTYDRVNDRPRRQKSEHGMHSRFRDDDSEDDGDDYRDYHHRSRKSSREQNQQRHDSSHSHHHYVPPTTFPDAVQRDAADRPLNSRGDNSHGDAAAGLAAGGAAGAAWAEEHNRTHNEPQSTQSPPSSGSTYVPYSNIYGQPQPTSTQAPPYPSSTAPPSSVGDGSLRPTAYNQTLIPVAKQEGYHQNPYAQEAAYGGQPSYTPDPYPPPPPRDEELAEKRGLPSFDGDRRRNYNTSNDGRRSPSYSPNRGDSRRSRRGYSPSADSYDSRYGGSQRRARSARPGQTLRGGGGDRAVGKPKDSGPFDKSKKGLKYGAAGALYGGLLGSEFGKLPWGPLIGAAIGGLGANAFEAKERRESEAEQRQVDGATRRVRSRRHDSYATYDGACDSDHDEDEYDQRYDSPSRYHDESRYTARPRGPQRYGSRHGDGYYSD